MTHALQKSRVCTASRNEGCCTITEDHSNSDADLQNVVRAGHERAATNSDSRTHFEEWYEKGISN